MTVVLSVQVTVTFVLFCPGPDEVVAATGIESVGIGLVSWAAKPRLAKVTEPLQVAVSPAVTERLVTKIGKLLGFTKVKVSVFAATGPTPVTDPWMQKLPVAQDVTGPARVTPDTSDDTVAD